MTNAAPEPKGFIFNIQRFSVNDGPGIRTTVFLKGCPLNCRWCHNPESQASQADVIFRRNRCTCCGECADNCPEHAITIHEEAITDLSTCTRCGTCIDHCFSDAREIVGKEMPCSEVVAEIEKDRRFYDQSGGGVTLSGGEPLTQAEFTLVLLKRCRDTGIHTVLDTSGYTAWRIIDAIRSHVDLFLYDLKVIENKKHQLHVGVSNQLILDNLRRLDENGHAIVLRVPIVPGVTDDHDNIEGIASLAKSLPNVRQVDILPYHHIAVEKYERLQQEYQLPGCRPPTRDHMVKIKSLIEKTGIRVSIGG